MKVIIELPEATPHDAAIFGLWIKSIVDGAREDGDLDMAVGDIKVLS